MEKKYCFWVDAESDGLYGAFITVAGIITDFEGKEIERFYYGVARNKIHTENVWVQEHVIPLLGNYDEYDSETELLEAFWKKWLEYQSKAYAVGDVIYPVESRLFRKCVEIDEEQRMCFAPYPLLDLASMLFIEGVEPLIDRTALVETAQKTSQHNALADVEMSIKVWEKLKMSNKKVYSHHTFIYVFTYEQSKKEKRKHVELENWEPIQDTIEILGKEDAKSLDIYNLLGYFTPKACSIILNEKDNLTSENYKYRIPEGTSLELGINYKEQKELFLPIADIKLSIFQQLCVGILSIGVDNSVKEWTNFQGALKINEYGRRLYFPSINYDEKGTVSSYISTNGLQIRKGHKSVVNVNFREQCNNYLEAAKDTTIHSKFIEDLLGDAIRNKYQMSNIYSVFDDRMFVCSVIMDDELSQKVKEYEENEGKAGKDKEWENWLYAYTFVDEFGASCSCQNRIKRQKELEEHIYSRWSGYGTIYGITEYSLVCITGTGVENSVVNPFQNLYIEMVKLSLLQRATLNILEKEISDICKKIRENKNKGKISIKEISNVWKQYVIYQNELYLPEATFQLQGVEIYDMLKNFLKIDYLNNQIGQELDNLHEYAELRKNENTNVTMNFFAILIGAAALSDVYSIIDTVAGWLKKFGVIAVFKLIVMVLGILFIVYVICRIKKDKV